jgi:hypothetical protein
VRSQGGHSPRGAHRWPAQGRGRGFRSGPRGFTFPFPVGVRVTQHTTKHSTEYGSCPPTSPKGDPVPSSHHPTLPSQAPRSPPYCHYGAVTLAGLEDAQCPLTVRQTTVPCPEMSWHQPGVADGECGLFPNGNFSLRVCLSVSHTCHPTDGLLGQKEPGRCLLPSWIGGLTQLCTPELSDPYLVTCRRQAGHGAWCSDSSLPKCTAGLDLPFCLHLP